MTTEIEAVTITEIEIEAPGQPTRGLWTVYRRALRAEIAWYYPDARINIWQRREGDPLRVVHCKDAQGRDVSPGGVIESAHYAALASVAEEPVLQETPHVNRQELLQRLSAVWLTGADNDLLSFLLDVAERLGVDPHNLSNGALDHWLRREMDHIADVCAGSALNG